VRLGRSSYALKHAAERWAGEYVSNGAFILAALELDVVTRPCRGLAGINAIFALRPKRTNGRRRT